MDVIKVMQEQMIYITLILFFIGGLTGLYYHDVYLSLKFTLPISLFLMLLKPMVYMDIKKAFSSINKIKLKYLILTTLFYVSVFPLLTYGFMNLIMAMLPSLDPRIVAAIVIIGLSPIASSVPAFVGMSKGRVQLALVGIIWTFLLSIVIVPVYGSWMLHAVIKVPMYLLFKSITLYVLVPLAAGQTLKYFVLWIKGNEGLEVLRRPLSFLSLLGLYLMVIEVFGINSQAVLSMSVEVIALIALMYVYHLTRFSISYYAGKIVGMPADRRVSLAYSSCVNMTMSTAIAIATFGTLAGVGTIFAGPFSEMILMIALVKVFRKIVDAEDLEKNETGLITQLRVNK